MKKDKRFYLYNFQNGYPYHFLNGLGELYTICDVVIFVEIDDVPAPNVAVLLMSENYMYFAITNEYGAALFPKIADDDYTLYLAKSGLNQAEFENTKFDKIDTFLDVLYRSGEKNVYNGMFATTPEQMYVDVLDGGGA